MISADGQFVHCDVEGCEAKIKNHKWGRIHAGSAGWFFGATYPRNVWCPDHLPEWVESWRARKTGARP